jgi:3-methylcrotonyl-CoA carboxylase alpha subunit
MLAKVIAYGADRGAALRRLDTALAGVRIAGPKTNTAFLSAVIAHPYFRAGGVDTGFVDRDLARLVGAPLAAVLAQTAIAEWVRRSTSLAAARAPGPWARGDAFETAGRARNTNLAVEIGGEPTIVELAWSASGAEIVAIGGAPPGPAAEAEIVWAGSHAFVLDRGRQLEVVFPDPLARDLEAATLGGKVTAPMPGRIADVAVKEGARVEKGAPLFTLEAMKMEHAVAAPLAGIVRELRVAAGDQVEQGMVAMVIELEKADT